MTNTPDKPKKQAGPKEWPWSVSLYYGSEKEPRQQYGGDHEDPGRREWLLGGLDNVLATAKGKLKEGLGVRVVCDVPPEELESFLEDLRLRGLEAGWSFKTDAEAGRVELVSADSQEALRSVEGIRSGVHLERQKQGRRPDEIQPFLPGLELEKLQDEALLVGLDLSLSEDRALHALQVLLHQTNYKGHGRVLQKDKKKHTWGDVEVPYVQFRAHQFLEAYGLDTDRRQGKSFQTAFKGLHGLAETPRLIMYHSKYIRDGREFTRTITTKRPLVNLTKDYGERPLKEGQELAERIKGGERPSDPNTTFTVVFSPLVLDGLEDKYYLLKSPSFHKEIQEVAGPNYSQAIPKFIYFLLTLDMPKLTIYQKNLAIKMGLHGDIERRKWTRIEERIKEAFKIAKELNYLEKSSKRGDKYTLWLDPRRCTRPWTDTAKRKRGELKKPQEQKAPAGEAQA